jgi:hypothetical protein
MAKQIILNRIIHHLNELNRVDLNLFNKIILRLHINSMFGQDTKDVSFDKMKAKAIALEVSEYLHQRTIGKELFGLLNSFNFKGSKLAVAVVKNVSAEIYGQNAVGESFLNIRIDLSKDELKNLLGEIDEIIK